MTPVGMKTSYKAVSMERKTTHVEFVQGDVSGKEDYSRYFVQGGVNGNKDYSR